MTYLGFFDRYPFLIGTSGIDGIVDKSGDLWTQVLWDGFCNEVRRLRRIGSEEVYPRDGKSACWLVAIDLFRNMLKPRTLDRFLRARTMRFSSVDRACLDPFPACNMYVIRFIAVLSDRNKGLTHWFILLRVADKRWILVENYAALLAQSAEAFVTEYDHEPRVITLQESSDTTAFITQACDQTYVARKFKRLRCYESCPDFYVAAAHRFPCPQTALAFIKTKLGTARE